MAKVFDVDDVLLNFVEPLLNFGKREGFLRPDITKSDIKSFDLWKNWGCTKEESMEILEKFYDSEDFYRLPANQGMVGLIRRISRKESIYVVSHRPSDLEGLTRLQLGRNYGGIFRAIILTDNFGGNGTKSKAEYCEEFGASALVDDKLSNFNGLNHGALKIVYDQPWNQQSKEEDLGQGLLRAMNAEDIDRIISLGR